jgi:hypothetical protein
MHRLVELIVLIPTSQRSSKTESGCSSYDRFGFSCFCLFQGQRLRTRRAGDSTQNVFSPFFVQSFGPEPPGTFPGQRLRPLGTGDSGPSLRTSKARGVAQRRDGGRGFLAPFFLLGRRKWPATAIFVGRPIKGPLLPPWAVATPSLSPPLLTLSSLPSLLHSSHAS